MKRITFPFLFLLLTIPLLVSAQQKREYTKKAPVLQESTLLNKNFVPQGKTLADGNYIPIDTMGNAFGPAIGSLNPFAFDPYSGALTFVHRGWATSAGGYAASSGELWYNISTDFGVTWQRVPGGVNTGNTQLFARYPSMSISNPSKGNISGTIAFFAWPELTKGGAGFGQFGYGADQPAGGGAFAAFIDPGDPQDYISSSRCWASDNSPEMFWTAEYYNTYAGVDLWKTSDFGTITKSSPPQWSDSVLNNGGSVVIGGDSYKGVQYFGLLGTFNPYYWVDTNQMRSGWTPGYSKSTDNGTTWSDFKIADFRHIPKLANYTRLFDYKKGDTFISYQGDLRVDKNGYVHLLIQVADTLGADVDKEAALVDIFETATGWDATVVTKDLDITGNIWLLGPGLGQMGPSSYLALDSTRSIMAAQWVNIGTGGYADIWMSHKLLTDTAWSAPVNLTSSGTINNTQSHLAPFIRATKLSGDTYECSAFSMYGYVTGVSGPFADTTLPTTVYTGVEKFTVTLTGINDQVNTVNSFSLLQNYPNPFNPGTLINYSLPVRTNVSLKVYDMLGREVANLVNGTQEAGSHAVSFNASKLASGIYIYTLRAGNSSMSKKMMLLK